MADPQVCPFCVIDEARQQPLLKGKNVYVMQSYPQLVPLHLLVIPRRHVEFPWKLTVEEHQEITLTTLALQQKMLEFRDGWGCDVTQHCRPFQPQDERKVDHCHWHIRPRTYFDELYREVQKHETALFSKGRLAPKKMEEEAAILRVILGLPQS